MESEDETRLRAIADELDAVMKKHDVGGVAMITSTAYAAWIHNRPSWADVVDNDQGLRVNIRQPLDAFRARATIHMLGCLRDMASDCLTIYGRLYRNARSRLRELGAETIETEVSGGSNRILDILNKMN